MGVVQGDTAMEMLLGLSLLGAVAIGLIIGRSVYRSESLRRAARSYGLVPIAYARKGSMVIGAETPPRNLRGSLERRLRENPTAARLVLCTDGLKEPITSGRVWDMIRRREMLWFPGARATGALGFKYFEVIVRADPELHAAAAAGLDEYYSLRLRWALLALPLLLVVLIFTWRTYG